MTSSTQYTDPRQALRTKATDPRYVSGASHHHDGMTDEEWFDFMGRPAAATLVVAPAVPVREAPENAAARAWKTFHEESAEHVLTVLHDDGLYRHLRMAAPGPRMWSWDIVTWPGHLATSGDIADGYTFSREPDMIGFFGQPKGLRPYFSDGAPSIDFRYWAEKLQGEQRDTVKEYKHELFVEYVKETLEDEKEYGEELAQERIDELVAEARVAEENPLGALAWLEQYPDHFSEPWDHSFRDYTFTFQLACYAVNAAVQAYLKHKDASKAEPEAEDAGEQH